MKKKLFSLIALSALGLPSMYAESLCINLKNGETVSFNVDDIEEVTICEDDSVVNIADTPLEFKILSDSTVELSQESSWFSGGVSYNEFTEIDVPAKVRIDGKVYTVVGIGSGAFYYCDNIRKVTLPPTIKYIDDNAFYGCKKLTKADIPAGVTRIGNSAFLSTMITKVEISANVEEIDVAAFLDCPNLTTIKVSEDNPYYTTINNDAALCNKEKTELICIAGGHANFNIPSGIQKIAYGAFLGSSVVSVHIPSTVTEIEAHAFYGCKQLEKLEMPSSVTTIHSQLFYGCEKLKEVTLSPSITEITGYMFYQCKSLESITIPSSVQKIDTHAFDSCTQLSTIEIPAKVSEIVPNAFDGCTSLRTIKVDRDNQYYKSDQGCLLDKEMETLIRVPEGYNETFLVSIKTKTIADCAFANCTELTKVTFPGSTEPTIGKYAFLGCTGLTSLWIDSSIIGEHAFKGCVNLDLTIAKAKDQVTVGTEAFDDCKSVTYTK
ncbi:MAG: leucine-rich repeat domain-containing protein [Paludibacteraceae bacterium]|nr:leucine-rich repeat domain-containing protein [Paludibacteraceae bacterium]